MFISQDTSRSVRIVVRIYQDDENGMYASSSSSVTGRRQMWSNEDNWSTSCSRSISTANKDHAILQHLAKVSRIY